MSDGDVELGLSEEDLGIRSHEKAKVSASAEAAKKAAGTINTFESMGKAADKSSYEKAGEYRQRIEAVLAGRELRPGDSQNIDQLRKDYLLFGGENVWETNSTLSGQPSVEQPPSIDFGDNNENPKIIGGEIITPTAVRVPGLGETYEQVRKEAEIQGYLSAMTKCMSRETNERYTTQQKENDLQAIIDAAKKDGVPKENIREHLKRINPSIDIKDAAMQNAVEDKGEDQDLLPSGKKATWVRVGAQFDEQGNFHLGEGEISSRMSRPHSQASMAEGAAETSSFGIHIPPQIDSEAYFKAKEVGDTSLYLDNIGKAMGWIENPPGSGEWIIPASQIEKIPGDRAVKIVSKKARK